MIASVWYPMRYPRPRRYPPGTHGLYDGGNRRSEPPMTTATPTASIITRAHNGQPFYEAKFRHNGRQIKRRIGPAWLELDPDTGGWRPRRGRVPDGAYDERAAIIAASQLVAAHVAEAADIERAEHE